MAMPMYNSCLVLWCAVLDSVDRWFGVLGLGGGHLVAVA
jgi:hypothetical protein